MSGAVRFRSVKRSALDSQQRVAWGRVRADARRLWPLAGREVVDQAANAAGRRADAGAFFPTGQRADGRSRPGATADDEQLFLPGAAMFMRGRGAP